MINPISFKANYINQTYVFHEKSQKELLPENASFIELEPLNEDDLKAVVDISKKWKNGESYANSVANNMVDYFVFKNNNNVEQFYALTQQMDSFDRLEPDKILGVVQTTDCGEEVMLDYLQTKPEYINKHNLSKIKKIGTVILDCLKSKKQLKDFVVDADFGAIPFYEKNGFERCSSDSTKMVYRALPKKI